MKVVINNNWGGFGCGVDETTRDWLRQFRYDGNKRADTELVRFVENNPDKCGDLIVIELPNEATDFDIQDYDGIETMVFVVDGKIYYADGDFDLDEFYGIETDDDDDDWD